MKKIESENKAHDKQWGLGEAQYSQQRQSSIETSEEGKDDK